MKINRANISLGRLLHHLHSAAHEDVARFAHISRQVRAQGEAHRQAAAAVDGADPARDGNLFGHVDSRWAAHRHRGNYALWARSRVASTQFAPPPSINQIDDIEGLKFKQCSYNGWDHAMAIGEVLFLLWGIRVCYNVRNAESLYNEAKLISYAIYNIAFVNMLMVAIQWVLIDCPFSPSLYPSLLGTDLTLCVMSCYQLRGSWANAACRRQK